MLEQAMAVRKREDEVFLRISANVTGDFGNVTDFGRALGCAEKIVGMEWIRAGLEPPRLMLMGA
jgi:hypothetical protein